MFSDQIAKEIKCVAPFLAPFIKTCCIYFILELKQPSIFHATIKVLPIISLIVFVSWVQRSHSNVYNKWILMGLIFGGIGDVALIWQETHMNFFLLGTSSFAIGHICYFTGFGFRPFGVKEFIFTVVTGIVVFGNLYPNLDPPIIAVFLTTYAFVIGIMWWRATARFNLQGDIPWRKIYAAVGATFFVISDTSLTINKFCFPVPYEKEVIMVSYYLAQMCLALSVINSRVIAKDNRKEFDVDKHPVDTQHVNEDEPFKKHVLRLKKET